MITFLPLVHSSRGRPHSVHQTPLREKLLVSTLWTTLSTCVNLLKEIVFDEKQEGGVAPLLNLSKLKSFVILPSPLSGEKNAAQGGDSLQKPDWAGTGCTTQHILTGYQIPAEHLPRQFCQFPYIFPTP